MMREQDFSKFPATRQLLDLMERDERHHRQNSLRRGLDFSAMSMLDHLAADDKRMSSRTQQQQPQQSSCHRRGCSSIESSSLSLFPRIAWSSSSNESILSASDSLCGKLESTKLSSSPTSSTGDLLAAAANASFLCCSLKNNAGAACHPKRKRSPGLVRSKEVVCLTAIDVGSDDADDETANEQEDSYPSFYPSNKRYKNAIISTPIVPLVDFGGDVSKSCINNKNNNSINKNSSSKDDGLRSLAWNTNKILVMAQNRGPVNNGSSKVVNTPTSTTNAKELLLVQTLHEQTNQSVHSIIQKLFDDCPFPTCPYPPVHTYNTTSS